MRNQIRGSPQRVTTPVLSQCQEGIGELKGRAAAGQGILSLWPAVHLGRGVTGPVHPVPSAVDTAEGTDSDMLHALEPYFDFVICSGATQQLLK